jgi:hypothetical protein
MAAKPPYPGPALPTGQPSSAGLATGACAAVGGFLLRTLALRDVLAWLGLALATLAVLWPLGLTDRVLAGVDALTYFTPYWAYRLSALRAGQIPLWNPYLFLGAPFLANPQAAVLYPLHWPLSWLSPASALIWSALLHTWLAAGFTYTFGRRSLGLTRPAAWLAGCALAAGRERGRQRLAGPSALGRGPGGSPGPAVPGGPHADDVR